MEHFKYAVIFTSRLSKIDKTSYFEMAQKMEEMVKTQKGFLGLESARNPDGTGLTISYWDSLESIKAWKENSDHKVAQKLGREKWYENFSVRICKVEHEYG